MVLEHQEQHPSTSTVSPMRRDKNLRTEDILMAIIKELVCMPKYGSTEIKR